MVFLFIFFSSIAAFFVMGCFFNKKKIGRATLTPNPSSCEANPKDGGKVRRGLTKHPPRRGVREKKK
jgi:hypothetical protein